MGMLLMMMRMMMMMRMAMTVISRMAAVTMIPNLSVKTPSC